MDGKHDHHGFKHPRQLTHDATRMIMISVIFSLCFWLLGAISWVSIGVNLMLVERAMLITFAFDLLARLLSIGRFLGWLHLAVSNAQYLRRDAMRISPADAVIAWFVPLYGAIGPLFSMRQLAVASTPESVSRDKPLQVSIMLWWLGWTCFTTSFLILLWTGAPGFESAVPIALEISYVLAGLCLTRAMRKIAMYQDMSFAEQQAAPNIPREEKDVYWREATPLVRPTGELENRVEGDSSDQTISLVEETELQS